MYAPHAAQKDLAEAMAAAAKREAQLRADLERLDQERQRLATASQQSMQEAERQRHEAEALRKKEQEREVLLAAAEVKLKEEHERLMELERQQKEEEERRASMLGQRQAAVAVAVPDVCKVLHRKMK